MLTISRTTTSRSLGVIAAGIGGFVSYMFRSPFGRRAFSLNLGATASTNEARAGKAVSKFTTFGHFQPDACPEVCTSAL
jgi:hypothetical protein